MRTLSNRRFVMSTLLLLAWTPTLWAAGLERTTTHPTAPAARAAQAPVANNPALQPMNSGSGKLQAGTADLLVQSAKWSAPPAAGQQVGISSILNIDIRNSGKAPAPATQLTISCEADAGSPCPAGLNSTLNVPPLGINQLQGMPWPAKSSSVWSAGKYRLVLNLDPRNQIPESNELNNKLILNVDIAAPLRADSGVHKNPQAPQQGMTAASLHAAVIPVRGMTAIQFQTLPDSTLLELRGKTITKGELVKQMNAAWSSALADAKAGSPKATARLQQKRVESLQKHKQLIEPMNARVRARMATVTNRKMSSSTQPPDITGVYGTVTPGGLVQIVGSNFGDNPGSIKLRGKFPKNSDLVTLKVDQWYSDGVSGKVPWVGGAFEQSATIEVTPLGGKTAQHAVTFIPIIRQNLIPASMFTGNNCSKEATFHDECNISGPWPGVILNLSGLHQDVAGIEPTSMGVDTFSFDNLRSEYELIVVDDDMGTHVQGTVKCTPFGHTIECSWGDPSVAPVSANGNVTSYSVQIWAVGPEMGNEPGE